MNRAEMECLGKDVAVGWSSEVCGLRSLVWSHVEVRERMAVAVW